MEKLTPTQRLVYEEIKAMVRGGGIRVLPTELTLARKIGISKPVVHKMLKLLTAQGEIPPVVGKKRYLRNVDGKDSSELSMIAVVNMTGALNHVLRTALWDTIVLVGYNPVFIEITQRDLNRMNSIRSPVLKFEGVIAATVWDSKILEWIESFGCPVVVLDHISETRRFADILPDERKGCKKVVEFFHQCGVRSVVYFDHMSESWNPPRWNAFVAAANSCGIEISDRIFANGASDIGFWETTVKQMSRGRGVFCANQGDCEGFLRGMTKYNLRMPSDYVVAYAGENVLSYNGVHLARYALDWEKAAEIACNTMLDLIKTPRISMKRRLFPVKFFRSKTP